MEPFVVAFLRGFACLLVAFPSRSSPLFLSAKAVQTSEMPNLFEHFATSAACFRTQCKGAIFLAYYRQLLSTKCIEIVYFFLEKRKSIEISLDFACEKKNSMTKPFLLFPSFGCNHYGKCEISSIFRGGLCEIHA